MTHEDPMGTGVPSLPEYQAWKAEMAALVRARYPSVAEDVVANGPWVEGWEDRNDRTPDDLAGWLVRARCAELGQDAPAPAEG